jgi:hypothetical protein
MQSEAANTCKQARKARAAKDLRPSHCHWISVTPESGAGFRGTTFCAVHLYEKTGEPATFERTVDAAVMGGEPVGRAEIAAFENVRPYMDQLVGSTVVNVSGLI